VPRKEPTALRLGSTLLACSSLGLLAAPITIVATIPDLTTRASRHAFAGALGLTALAVLEFILALIPIRRGERWALGAAAMPFVVVGLPVLVADGTNVARARLWNTLAPQVLGLILGTTGLALCAVGMMRVRTRIDRSSEGPPNNEYLDSSVKQ
jgi:hypothetical protein